MKFTAVREVIRTPARHSRHRGETECQSRRLRDIWGQRSIGRRWGMTRKEEQSKAEPIPLVCEGMDTAKGKGSKGRTERVPFAASDSVGIALFREGVDGPLSSIRL